MYTLYNGTTQNVNFALDASGNGAVYSVPYQNLDQRAITLQGYFSPPTTGTYSLTFTSTDDIAYVYLGTTAYTTWGEGNQNIRNIQGATNAITQVFNAGTLYPITILYANGGYGGSLAMSITNPAGTVATDTTGYFFQPICSTGVFTTWQSINSTYQTTTTYYTGAATTTISTIQPSGTVSGTYVVEAPLPTWPCSNQAIVITNNALYYFDTVANQATSLIASNVGNPQGGFYDNGIGYNINDNYLYGTTTSTTAPEVFQIGSNGQIVNITTLQANVYGFSAGDVDASNQYWLFAGNNGYAQVSLAPANFGVVVSQGTATAPTYITDAVYLSGGGDALWSVNVVNAANVTLLRFDRTAKTWSTAVTYSLLTGNTGTAFTSMWAMSSTTFEALDVTTSQLWQFSVTGGAPVFITNVTLASSTSRDGARCLNNLPAAASAASTLVTAVRTTTTTTTTSSSSSAALPATTTANAGVCPAGYVINLLGLCILNLNAVTNPTTQQIVVASATGTATIRSSTSSSSSRASTSTAAAAGGCPAGTTLNLLGICI